MPFYITIIHRGVAMGWQEVTGVYQPLVLDRRTTYHVHYIGRPGLTFDSFRQSLKSHLFGNGSA